MPDSVSAAEVAIMATMSGSFSMSWESTVATICVSLLKPLGEQRPDRTVDEARGERLLLGGTALALEIAAGDLAGGEGLFLVVHGEREKVDANPASLAAVAVASTDVPPY